MIKAEFNDSINDLNTENLYQWDSYQTLKITGIDFNSVTPKVHFCNKKSSEALVVQGVLKSDGSCEVSIPNSLLSEKYDILAYVYTNTGLTFKTIKSITIPIIARLKPTNYTQPSNEQIIEIEEIELQAKAILDGLYASDYDNTKTYKRPNIVHYENCAYMCNSDAEIIGILPTDTTKWQKIAHGERITSTSVDSDGKLIFTTSSGSVHSIDFQTKDVVLMDDADIPALNLTTDDVNKVKNLTTDDVDKIRDIQDTELKVLAKTYNYTITNNYSYLVLVPESSVADASIRVYATSSDITQGTVLKKEIILKPFIHLIKYNHSDTNFSINVDGEITNVSISTEYTSTNVVLYRKDDLTSLYDNFIVLGA